jgi:DNA-binding winged helix-turn-helix (wHTH) protein
MPSPTPITDVVRFGTFQLDLKARELHKAGVKVKLQDQPFRVLAMLVQHAGQVVTREELQQKIWPTDVYVTFEQGLNNAIKKVRDALGDSADNPRFVETVARHGYRFVAPVSTLPGGSPEARSRFDLPILRRTALIALIAACLLAAFGYWAWHRPAIRDRPSSERAVLAVLPFDNLSHDPDQEFFSDGLTEEMIAHLGKLNPKLLNVIARGSVARYKSSSLTANQIGKELNG